MHQATRVVLNLVGDRHAAVVRSVVIDDGFGKIADHDDDFVDAGVGGVLQAEIHQSFAADLKQRFGGRVGLVPKPAALAACEDQRLHAGLPVSANSRMLARTQSMRPVSPSFGRTDGAKPNVDFALSMSETK